MTDLVSDNQTTSVSSTAGQRDDTSWAAPTDIRGVSVVVAGVAIAVVAKLLAVAELPTTVSVVVIGAVALCACLLVVAETMHIVNHRTRNVPDRWLPDPDDTTTGNDDGVGTGRDTVADSDSDSADDSVVVYRLDI